MESALTPISTNHVAVLSNVSLIKAQIGNEQALFKTEVIHYARFVVMCLNLLPPYRPKSTFVVVSYQSKLRFG